MAIRQEPRKHGDPIVSLITPAARAHDKGIQMRLATWQIQGCHPPQTSAAS